MNKPLHGLVLHIQQGKEAGTFGWFNNPKSKVSAHFGNPKRGRMEQFVRIDDIAYAEVAGNRDWVSVENEGFAGQDLTDSQVNNVAGLLGWLRWNRGVPLKLANSPNDFGLGFHAMGGRPWGGHPACPGPRIVEQRALILERAGFWRPPNEPLAV
jgi:hypothetical protein